jgi:hypothetical protein
VSPRSKTQKVNDWNTLTSSEKRALRNTLLMMGGVRGGTTNALQSLKRPQDTGI